MKSCLYGLNFQAPIRAQSELATEFKYEMRSWLSGKHWRHHFMVMSSVRTPPALKKFPAMGINYDDVRVGGSGVMLRLSALVVELLLERLTRAVGALSELFSVPVCFLHDGLLEGLPKLAKATRVVCGGPLVIILAIRGIEPRADLLESPRLTTKLRRCHDINLFPTADHYILPPSQEAGALFSTNL